MAPSDVSVQVYSVSREVHVQQCFGIERKYCWWISCPGKPLSMRTDTAKHHKSFVMPSRLNVQECWRRGSYFIMTTRARILSIRRRNWSRSLGEKWSDTLRTALTSHPEISTCLSPWRIPRRDEVRDGWRVTTPIFVGNADGIWYDDGIQK